MKPGYLSEYFEAVAAKRLSVVESDMMKSHQHEFNGVKELRDILGEPVGTERHDASFMYLDDETDEPLTEPGFLTWYDARQKGRIERGVMRWEYRLYFPTTDVSQRAAFGDLLVIAKVRDGRLLCIIARAGSGMANQIEWLFGLKTASLPGFSVLTRLDRESDRLRFASRAILESIGVAVETTAPDYLAVMLERFGGKFPTTRIFSAYARSTLPETDAAADPDTVLMEWMEREEILFRTLERHLIASRLAEGFAGQASQQVDVEGFIAFSLSVQNRRKSRVGLAFENHLEVLFSRHGLHFSRTPTTENRARPDFLFPGEAEYHDPDFAAAGLTMLGVKSTCKDRWRQVLAEADRIAEKHLLTLETSISAQQTDEMAAKRLTLVLPARLHETYTGAQRAGLATVAEFIALVRQRQESR